MFRTQVRMRHKDGRLLWVDLSGAPLPNDESLWMMVDITAMKDSEMQARHQALHDSLTGLANRLQLTDALAYVLRNSERHGHKVAVCYIDLDGLQGRQRHPGPRRRRRRAARGRQAPEQLRARQRPGGPAGAATSSPSSWASCTTTTSWAWP